MAVSLIGTPLNTTTTGTSPTSATSAWNSDQPRTAGDLLLAIVSVGSASVITSPSATASGWSSLLSISNRGALGSGTARNYIVVLSLTATGGDGAPTPTIVTNGTSSADVSLFEFSGANTSSIVDTSGTESDGTSAGTEVFNCTTSGNVSSGGEYALAAFNQTGPSGAVGTWTNTGAGTTVLISNGTTSQVGHTEVVGAAGPSSGSTFNEGGNFSTHNTSYFGAGIVFAINAAITPGYVITPMLQVNQAINTAAVW